MWALKTGVWSRARFGVTKHSYHFHNLGSFGHKERTKMCGARKLPTLGNTGRDCHNLVIALDRFHKDVTPLATDFKSFQVSSVFWTEYTLR